ncbi:MAG: FAD-dependent thymidylate synthase [Clostridia bacterium]|nr:FAD-dependent thymidylate synthase [Clostridia bacterium]
MNIQIKMHSELDCPLQPDIELITRAIADMEKEGKYNPQFIRTLKVKVAAYYDAIEQEQELSAKIKVATGDEKEALKFEKKNIIARSNILLDDCFIWLTSIGGKQHYHYTYDLHFNRIVAGLMGSTCYMKDTFKQLQEKRISDIRIIAKVVEQNGHHSTFGHSHMTLEITGIPKALAMVLNNEREYCTSEKSARYTEMDEMEEQESELFHKWKGIFEKAIDEKYGRCQPFFDARGARTGKLAQENARYMLSIFTPSNMVYTTSFRQFNYICHWFEDVIKSKYPNAFYGPIIPAMKEFVKWFKENNLYSATIADGKGRKLSLFGEPLIEETRNSDVFAISYQMSGAAFAQSQRHRTNPHHISEKEFEVYTPQYYVPPIIKGTKLEPQYLADIQSVADHIPQGRLLPVIETGKTSDFLLKGYERVCALAQKEIRDLTQAQCRQFASALQQELETLATRTHSPGNGKMLQVLLAKHAEVMRMLEKFERMAKGARCTAGYDCKEHCKFGDGISLDSLV